MGYESDICPECRSKLRTVRNPIEHNGALDLCANNWHWTGAELVPTTGRGAAPHTSFFLDVTLEPAFQGFMREMNDAFKKPLKSILKQYEYLKV